MVAGAARQAGRGRASGGQGMILVFGKSGQVAMELARQADIMALGSQDCDLMKPGLAAAAIRAYRPASVINAAAWTAVDGAEADEAGAYRLNHGTVAEMAESCASLDIPFLHISTDYVFDGSGQRPWREDDTPGPLNVYGASKLKGEEVVRASGARHIILRTSWVFSAHGVNFVKSMLRLAESRDHLNIVADQIGGPTPASDIAQVLLNLNNTLRDEVKAELYHYSGAPEISWAGFAREIFAQTGLDVQVSEIPSSDYPTPAKRPLNSRLDCSRIERDHGISRPDWRAGLSSILKEIRA